MGENVWHEEIPNEEDFSKELENLRNLMRDDLHLRAQSLELIGAARQYKHGYHLRWMGVPVIRFAEDLIRQQELIFTLRPDLIVEVGIARGGGLLFDASMQELAGKKPNVVGIDNRILAHTRKALSKSRYSEEISLLEADSDSKIAVDFVRNAIEGCSTALLILDSDHSSRHVLSELRSYYPLLPVGSVILVCDTIIDEYPAGTFPDRSWSDGRGPGHAIGEFVSETLGAEVDTLATSDLLITEIRGGVIRKVEYTAQI
jgi:cephalosporin hydroxylase